jgi:hypothetical protein
MAGATAATVATVGEPVGLAAAEAGATAAISPPTAIVALAATAVAQWEILRAMVVNSFGCRSCEGASLG